MGKSLGDKLWEKAGKVRKSIRNYVLLGTAVASLGLGSCKFPCPNYPPEAILQVSNTSDNNYNLNLSGTDKNGDYDITEYEVSIDEGDNGTIEEVVNQSSPININRMFNENTRIYGQVTDSQNATNKKEQLITISNPPLDYLDISGVLQDNETDSNQQGIIRIYDASDNSLIGNEHSVNGSFSITLDKLVSEVPSGVIVQARSGTSSNPTSYVRTVGSSNPFKGDISNLTIRVVPYVDIDGGGITEQEKIDFKKHMKEVNFDDGIEHLMKYYITNIGILDPNPLNSSYSFSNESNIRSHITSFCGIIGKDIPITLNPYEAYTISDTITPKNGWIIIVPDNSLIGSAETKPIGNGQQYSYGSALIVLNGSVDNPTPDGVIYHELGHSLVFPGHAETLATLRTDGKYYTNEKTIMAEVIDVSNMGTADTKAAKIIYEDTYKAGEPLNDILGDNFYQ